MQTLDDYEFLIAPLIFTAFALFTRLWKIGLSNIVTWDEAQYDLCAMFKTMLTFPQFWQIRLPLPQTRVLLRCTSTTWKDVGRPIWLSGWIQRLL